MGLDKRKPENILAIDAALRLAKLFCAGWTKSYFTVKVSRFEFTPKMCFGYLVDVLACSLKEARIPDTEDGEHIVFHYRKLLL